MTFGCLVETLMEASSFPFRWFFLPYCLHRQNDGRYAVLNRKYKPVGMCVTDFVAYANHPCLVTMGGLTPELAAKVSCTSSASLERIYLYNDECVPDASAEHWTAYAARLQELAKIQVEI